MKENSLLPDLIVISLKFRDITTNFREICTMYNVASTMYNVASTIDMVELDKYKPQRVNQTVQK